MPLFYALFGTVVCIKKFILDMRYLNINYRGQ